MSTRPTEALPDFYIADPDNRTEPSGSKKTQGYSVQEPLPSQSFNWILYSISLWLKYVLDAVDGAGIGFGSLGDVNVNTNRNITNADDGKVIVLDSSGGSFTLTLPLISTMVNKKLSIVDLTGSLAAFPVTIARNSTEKIQGLGANYVLEADFGSWNLYCDGVQYYFV